MILFVPALCQDGAHPGGARLGRTYCCPKCVQPVRWGAVLSPVRGRAVSLVSIMSWAATWIVAV